MKAFTDCDFGLKKLKRKDEKIELVKFKELKLRIIDMIQKASIEMISIEIYGMKINVRDGVNGNLLKTVINVIKSC